MGAGLSGFGRVSSNRPAPAVRGPVDGRPGAAFRPKTKAPGRGRALPFRADDHVRGFKREALVRRLGAVSVASVPPAPGASRARLFTRRVRALETSGATAHGPAPLGEG